MEVGEKKEIERDEKEAIDEDRGGTRGRRMRWRMEKRCGGGRRKRWRKKRPWIEEGDGWRGGHRWTWR